MSQKKKKSKSKNVENTQDADKMMKAVVLLSLGAFLFFFYVSLSGFQGLLDNDQESTIANNNNQVLGVTTAPVENEDIAVKVNNANIGEAVLELHLPGAVALAGAEFHFALENSLEIQGVVCSSQFVCIDEYEDGFFHLSIFRLPDQADIPLNGVVKAATLLYADNSYGEMVLNGENSKPSMIAELGNNENLLSEEIQFFAVGRRAY